MEKLFKKQSELDNKIYEQHNVKAEDLLHEKVLALQVEINELANEVRECFKYWSTKKNSPKKVILEELVDGLHFLLSIGNLQGYNDYEYKQSELKDTLVDMFIGLNNITALLLTSDKDIYNKVFDNFINLSYALGFTWEEVEEAYNLKNQINHERQANQY